MLSAAGVLPAPVAYHIQICHRHAHPGRTSSMHPPSDPLDPLLERWRDAAPPLPEHLSAEVWRRIAATDTPTPHLSLFARIEAAFARPSFAVAFVAACTLLGLFLAEVRISRLQAEHNTQLVQSYLKLIDPLLETATTTRSEAAAPQS